MNKKIIFLLCFLSLELSAQIKDEHSAERIFSYGISTNTNSGLLGGAMLSYAKTVGSLNGMAVNRLFYLELVNVKHSKEVAEYRGISKLVYGKTNYLLVVRPEYGYDLALFQKKEDEGLGLNATLAIGPSIGIVKPYFVEYQYSKNGGTIIEPYDPQIHTDVSKLLGAGKFWSGFGESTINMGGHIRTGLSLDISTFNDAVLGIQVGFLAEYFSKEPQIMAFVQNKKFYPSAYISVFVGKK